MPKTKTKCRPHVTAHEIQDWVKWLLEHQEGCCHKPLRYADRNELCVCVGLRNVGDSDPDPDNPGRWIHKDSWEVVAMLGFQSYRNGMQTDLDIDFSMPWNSKSLCDKENDRLKKEGKYGEYCRCVEGDVCDTSWELCRDDGPVPSLHECSKCAKYLNENIGSAFSTLKYMEKDGVV